jgi:Ni,Fe-hydrogenase III large subunit
MRRNIDTDAWRFLLAEPDWELVGLWAEPGRVHLLRRIGADLDHVSLDCTASYPSVSAVRPSAVRLERAIHDLWGLVPEGLGDRRGWLRHDKEYDFLPVEGDGIHQVPVGPIHAGVIEPGHFRFHVQGETVVRLEQRLGYVHKGIERHMEGKTPAEAARLAARISGDSTVAHSLAFARAVEAALGQEVPPRAVFLRALMAELERVANHFGDVGAICNDAAFAFIHAQCQMLREETLRTADALFGHRLMMDRVVPGGVAQDLGDAGKLRRFIAAARPRFAEVVAVYDDKPSLDDRTNTTGITRKALVDRFAAGGYVGRAAGRAHDARKNPGYPPYEALSFEVPVFEAGDVNARVWVRIREIEESLKLLEQILDRLPAGPIAAALPERAGEGLALAEGFRGEILCWVRLDEAGRIARCHPRDPSWFQWPLLEAAIEDNIIADFPLCNKSFNCSYAGHDL